MKRILASILALLLFVQVLFADVTIADNNRVQNRPGGYCVWCCIDMIARQHDHKSLIGITDKKERATKTDGESGGASIDDIVDELKQHNVKYWIQRQGNTDTDILKSAQKKNLPILIGLIGYPNSDSAHAVLMVGSDDKNVRFIDPNHADRIYEGSWEWFFSCWDGYTAVIDKPNQ